jgi:hypothetical protein
VKVGTLGFILHLPQHLVEPAWSTERFIGDILVDLKAVA